jgi:2-hydroxy-3-keto-5-methylthiopentenyl-1-phosphate phosphatase
LEDSELFKKYHPIERDPNISIEEKKEKMLEWWKASFEVFIKYSLNKINLRNIAKSEHIEIRKGIIEFLKFLKENNIPLIIISAS